MLALLFGAVSLLYATVGQAGGTAFLAVMAFSSFAAHEMRPTALLLNIVAATYSTWLGNIEPLDLGPLTCGGNEIAGDIDADDSGASPRDQTRGPPGSGCEAEHPLAGFWVETQ